ncbi:MAG: hypothetical protein WBB04_03025, partial [Candidatus Macondimonas sp.]
CWPVGWRVPGTGSGLPLAGGHPDQRRGDAGQAFASKQIGGHGENEPPRPSRRQAAGLHGDRNAQEPYAVS